MWIRLLRPRTLAKFALLALILMAACSVVLELATPAPLLPPLVTLAESRGLALPAFAPDGSAMAAVARGTGERAGGVRGPVRVWSLPDGELLATLVPDWDFVAPWTMRFSPDGRHLAVESRERIGLWHVRTGQELALLPGGCKTNYWGNFHFSPDGKLFAAGSAKAKQVTVCDTSTGKALLTLDGALPPLEFAPDGLTLATAADEGVQYWGVTTGKKTGSFGLEAASLRSLAFSPNGQLLAIAQHWSGLGRGLDEVRLYDVPSGKELGVLIKSATVFQFQFAADSTVLLAWDFGKLQAAWDVAKRPPQLLAVPSSQAVWYDAPDGKLLGGWQNGIPGVWDPTRGRQKADFTEFNVGREYSFVLSRNGQTLAARTTGPPHAGGLAQLFGPRGTPESKGQGHGETLLISMATGAVLARMELSLDGSLTPDGTLYVGEVRDQALRVWAVPKVTFFTVLRLRLAVFGMLVFLGLAWLLVSWLRSRRAEFGPRA